ncbi:MAG: hypothetical protein WD749_14225 [Phycisphaerales bacterium]
MTAEAIQDMLDQEPLQPFRLCLSSGESYDVMNPHTVALMKSRAFVALPNERWTFVSYLHIAALEAIANGHRPRRKRGR